MDKDSQEALSAMVDGELGRDETRFLTKRLASDEKLRSQFARYHAISAVIHRDYAPQADQLADRIRASLDQLPAHQRGRVWPSWLQPVAGLAVAASVALALVMAWPLVNQPASLPDTPVASTAPAPAQPATIYLAPVDQRLQLASQPAAGLDLELRQRINAYFINHSEHASTGQFGGTLKYARIVSHDTDR